MDPSSDVQVAFIRAVPRLRQCPSLVSLGSVYYEPLCVLPRRAIPTPPSLARKSAIGVRAGGTRARPSAPGRQCRCATPPNAGQRREEAADLLTRGKIHARVLVTPGVELVQKLAATPGIPAELRAGGRPQPALSYLTKLTAQGCSTSCATSRGACPAVADGKPHYRDTLHPALAYLMMRAAAGSGRAAANHGRRVSAALDAISKRRGQRYCQSGPPFLQRYLLLGRQPGGAAVGDRGACVLRSWCRWSKPCASLAHPFAHLPLVRTLEIELQLETTQTPKTGGNARTSRGCQACGESIPATRLLENLYSFRQHIDLVRQRVIVRLAARKRAPSVRTACWASVTSV
jgi:hypothetical protein